MATIYICGPGGARKIAEIGSAEQATSHVIRFLAQGHYSRVKNPGPGIFVAKRVGYPPDILFIYDENAFESNQNTGQLALNTGPIY